MGDVYGNVYLLYISFAYLLIYKFIIFKLIAFLLPLRVSEEEEELGLDATQHDEKYGRNPLKA